MWALFILKFIFVPGLILYNSWKLYCYSRAINTWSEATGVVIGCKYSGRNTYIEVEFQSAGDEKIKFEAESNLPFFTSLVYKKESEVTVLYSLDKPERALIKTTLSPISYSAWIVIGVWCYFILPYRF